MYHIGLPLQHGSEKNIIIQLSTFNSKHLRYWQTIWDRTQFESESDLLLSLSQSEVIRDSSVTFHPKLSRGWKTMWLLLAFCHMSRTQHVRHVHLQWQNSASVMRWKHKNEERLSITNFSSNNNLPTFRLNAPVVITVKVEHSVETLASYFPS